MIKGKDLLNLAEKHIGERYTLGAIAPKSNPGWKGPWDCAEFCSWVVFQLTGTLYGCHTTSDPALADAYTGFWARDVRNKGIKIGVEKAILTPGAALLRVPAPNLIGHIAFSDGEGGTIEAHSTKRGVIRAKATGRRWDMGILVQDIAYSENDTPLPTPRPIHVLRLLDPPIKSDAVKRVQHALKASGFDPGPIDGVYGPKSTAAVYAYQVTKGLTPDGEVGPLTARSLKISWP
jgi:N-acetylmuramoyl-L-alanine amidase